MISTYVIIDLTVMHCSGFGMLLSVVGFVRYVDFLQVCLLYQQVWVQLLLVFCYIGLMGYRRRYTIEEEDNVRLRT